MVKFAEATLTVPEAAYVAGVSERVVNHEIDARIVRVHGAKKTRALGAADVLYLGATREIRQEMTPKLRRQVRDAIAAALRGDKSAARIAALEVTFDSAAHEVIGNFETLERMKREYIESRPEVLAGEPVLKGTRIPARLVADLMKQGATLDEMQEEYDLVPGQVEAAVIFDRVTPKIGRPKIRKINPKMHVPPDR